MQKLAVKISFPGDLCGWGTQLPTVPTKPGKVGQLLNAKTEKKRNSVLGRQED